MKYTLHVPVEQYGFVSLEWEPSLDMADPKGTVAEAYKEIADAFKPKPLNEMPTADFNAILDDLLDDGSIQGDPGKLEKMSPVQQRIIQEVKKSLKRIK